MEYHEDLAEGLARRGRELPGPGSGFARLHKRAVDGLALTNKVKELMALAVSIAVRCEGCIAYRVHDSIAAFATRQGLLETIAVALMMGGARALMYAARPQDAVEPFFSRLPSARGWGNSAARVLVLEVLLEVAREARKFKKSYPVQPTWRWTTACRRGARIS